MKKISEIIREYKEAPSEELKNKIIDYLISMENPEDLDAVCPIPESDWFEFDHIRVKRLSGSVFAVAEVFGIDKYLMNSIVEIKEKANAMEEKVCNWEKLNAFFLNVIG